MPKSYKPEVPNVLVEQNLYLLEKYEINGNKG